MNRLVHDAVRRDLDRFHAALTTFSDGDSRRAQRIGDAWRFFATMLTKHHEGEDRVYFPVFADMMVDQELLDVLEHEHELMHEAMESANDAMSRFEKTHSKKDATAAGRALAVLDSVARAHMEHEEVGLEPAMDTLANDGRYRSADRRVRADFSPILAGQFLAWLQFGAPPTAIRLLHREIPAPMVWLLTNLVGSGYTRMARAAWR
ncbi:MAG: hemerythrin domain-containing protein [Nocardiaceae bacterium]|nr:hemerythrin domain-containing protein [Nocardiaceae bacterium]